MQTKILWSVFCPLLILSASVWSQPLPCGDYDDCDQVILKVRGIVRDSGGTPVDGAVVTGTENRRDEVGSIEFFEHCGSGLHTASGITSSTSLTGSNGEPGSYELLFIVCSQDLLDYAADFDICASAPGFTNACSVSEFDEGDDRDDLDLVLFPGKSSGEDSTEKGLPSGRCDSYDDCEMQLLKVRGFIRDGQGTAITNATVIGVMTSHSDINALQFYTHCGNGMHYIQTVESSISNSGGSAEAGFYELQFAVCAEDNFPPEFNLDVQVQVSAPGFEPQTVEATFDEDDDRDDRDFTLVGTTVDPTATPTSTPGMETPTMTPAATAANPAADIDGSGRIDAEDLIILLENWYAIVEN
jgi:hypothetical protein